MAEDYLAGHPPPTGVFLILVDRAPATVWKVSRSGAGVICNLEKRKEFVNHYSFHIMDPTWGMWSAGSGHRLHEGGKPLHSGQLARAPGSDRRHLLPLREDRAREPGHRPVDLHRVPVLRAQHRRAATKPFVYVYDYSIFQVEYSRNLVFASGAVMDRSPGSGAVDHRVGRREQPPRRRTWCTVECGRSTCGSSASRRGDQPVFSRSAQIPAASTASTWAGERCGRLERSARHANDAWSSTEAARHRATHPRRSTSRRSLGPRPERTSRPPRSHNGRRPTGRGR
jgi:hypothetical protein